MSVEPNNNYIKNLGLVFYMSFYFSFIAFLSLLYFIKALVHGRIGDLKKQKFFTTESLRSSFRLALLLKLRPRDQQHQHPLEACQKCRISGPSWTY